MRKEPIIAIALGSLLGLGVAFGVWKFTKTTQSISQKQAQKEIEKQEENSISNAGLSILAPLDNQVFTENPIRVSGMTSNNTFVVVNNGDNYQVLKANADGSFETEARLGGGIENIQVWALETEPKQVNVPVVFTAQLETGNYTATTGTVTDISEDTVQIKTANDQIEQISVSSNTTYANIVNDTKDIEFSELAIGDYVVAIGQVNDNSIVEAQRILVASVPAESSVRTIKGVIKSLTSREFLVDSSGSEYSIDATKKPTVTKLNAEGEIITARLSEASEGEEIIISGTQDEELVAELIHIFPVSE